MNHLPHSLIHTLLNLSQYLRRTLYLTNIFAAQAEWQKFCKAFYSNVWHKRAKLQHSIKISAKIQVKHNMVCFQPSVKPMCLFALHQLTYELAQGIKFNKILHGRMAASMKKPKRFNFLMINLRLQITACLVTRENYC